MGVVSLREKARGIEAVLARASVDRRFRRGLFDDRARALASCGVSLSEAERAVLLAASPEQLDAMIDGISPHVVDRRGWFARAAEVLGVFLGAAALSTGAASCIPTPVAGGARPESEPVVTGARPDERGDGK